MLAKQSAMAVYASDGGVAVPAKMFLQPVIDLVAPKADVAVQVLRQEDFGA